MADIRKKEEFSAFVEILRDGTVAHWQDIAIALNIDNDTVTAWRKLPEAQAAIQEGIQRALVGMEKAGGKDWRMWESKLKMLGITPKEKLDVTTKGKELPAPLLGGASVHRNHGDQKAK